MNDSHIENPYPPEEATNYCEIITILLPFERAGPADASTPSLVSVYPAKKSVLCAVMSPTRFNQSVHANLSQLLPAIGVCHYLIVDIAHGSPPNYRAIDYEFIRTFSRSLPVLFTIDEAMPADITKATHDQTFRNNLASVRKDLPTFAGLGYLTSMPGLQKRTTINTIVPVLRDLFRKLERALLEARVGAAEISNFFTITPDSTQYTAVYHDLLNALNGIVRFIIVNTVTKLQSFPCYAQARTSWDTGCFFSNSSQLTMVDIVKMTAKLKNLDSSVALTLSMTMTVIKGIDISAIMQAGRPHAIHRAKCANMTEDQYEVVCRTWLYSGSYAINYVHYLPDGCCNFVESQYPSEVLTFETPKSIEDKVRAAYKIVRDAPVLSWLAYNVSFNLAPSICGGINSRLRQFRELIESH
ncbi:hypothetical protein MRX96_013375 [Rhipicephalus microplus]